MSNPESGNGGIGIGPASALHAAGRQRPRNPGVSVNLFGGVDGPPLPKPGVVFLDERPLATARGGRGRGLWQPPREFLAVSAEPGIGDQVRPLVRVVAMVVELLGPVRIADVAPVFRANRVIAPVEGGNSRPRTRSLRI